MNRWSLQDLDKLPAERIPGTIHFPSEQFPERHGEPFSFAKKPNHQHIGPWTNKQWLIHYRQNEPSVQERTTAKEWPIVQLAVSAAGLAEQHYAATKPSPTTNRPPRRGEQAHALGILRQRWWNPFEACRR